MQLFRRMGPRVILVEHHGRLIGLVTVKDVITYIATERHYIPPWSARVGSEGLSEEMASWTRSRLESLYSLYRRVLRRR